MRQNRLLGLLFAVTLMLMVAPFKSNGEAYQAGVKHYKQSNTSSKYCFFDFLSESEQEDDAQDFVPENLVSGKLNIVPSGWLCVGQSFHDHLGFNKVKRPLFILTRKLLI